MVNKKIDKKIGVVIQHGCGHSIFLEKSTIEGMCAILCSGCGGMISISLFGSTVREQLLRKCEEFTQKEIKRRLAMK